MAPQKKKKKRNKREVHLLSRFRIHVVTAEALATAVAWGDPWPGNFHMLQEQPKRKNKNNTKELFLSYTKNYMTKYQLLKQYGTCRYTNKPNNGAEQKIQKKNWNIHR